MAKLKLTNAQYWQVRNTPMHYLVEYQFDSKTGMWEVNCDGPTSIEIKKIVDTPKPDMA